MAGRVRPFFSESGKHDEAAECTGFPVSLIGKFELVLAEWHLTPEYILDNWTDEQFEEFWQARNRRIVESERALRGKEEEPDLPSARVSDAELFALMQKSVLMPDEFDKFHA
jgi:predicted transglutaminase-like cysteine proteinase